MSNNTLTVEQIEEIELFLFKVDEDGTAYACQEYAPDSSKAPDELVTAVTDVRKALSTLDSLLDRYENILHK
jgi:hypothetical protein